MAISLSPTKKKKKGSGNFVGNFVGNLVVDFRGSQGLLTVQSDESGSGTAGSRITMPMEVDAVVRMEDTKENL